MAEAQAKVQKATELTDRGDFGSKKCSKNIDIDETENIEDQERWEDKFCVETQSELHPAFSDCVQVRPDLVVFCKEL